MAETDDAVYLNGWDIVAAVRLAPLNAAIRASRAWPAEFNATMDSGPVVFTGRFDDWQILPTNSETLVDIGASITCSELSSPELKLTNVRLTAVIEVELDFINKQITDGTLSQTAHLVIKTVSEGGDPPIAVKSITLHPDGDQPAIDPDVLSDQMSFAKMVLGPWLLANTEAFSHVFASVELNRTASQKRFQWLQPTSHAYDFTPMGDTDGFLSVLSMTEGRDPSGKDYGVTPLLFAQGHDAVFAVSRPRFMANIIVPGLLKMFDGLKASDVTISEPAGAISLATTDIERDESQLGLGLALGGMSAAAGIAAFVTGGVSLILGGDLKAPAVNSH